MSNQHYQFGNEHITDFYKSVITGSEAGNYNIKDKYFSELYLNPLTQIYDDPIFDKGEITSLRPILIAGDTITHPACPPDYNYKWPMLVAKELEMEFHSVALMGSSVIAQVRRIFAYIEKFGNPDYIFAVFSSFNRMEIPKNKNFYKYFRDTSDKEYDETNIRLADIVSDISNKSLSIPYDPEFIFSEELPQYYSSLFIQMLEQYCRQAKIKLVWSTWSSNQELVIKKAQAYNKYNNFVGLNNQNWIPDYDNVKYNLVENEKIQVCHQDLKNHDEFDFVITDPNNLHRSFWGIHRHIHVKDEFIKKIRELYGK